MPIFVLTSTHTADQCPTANSKVRERIMDQAPQIPKIAERLGINIVLGPLVLGAEHESVTVVETDKVETINDFLVETGLVQWQSTRVSLARPLPDALGEIERMPAALY